MIGRVTEYILIDTGLHVYLTESLLYFLNVAPFLEFIVSLNIV